MKNIKKLSLLAITLMLVGCGTETSTPTSSAPASETSVAPAQESVAPSYPSCTLNLVARETEVEIGQSVEVKAVLSGLPSGSDKTCTFTSSDESIATVTAESETKANVTGVKEGTVTITITPVINPTVAKTVTITVIKSKPTLRQAIKNLQALNSYTLSAGVYSAGNVTDIKNLTFVMEDAIIETDYDGYAVIKDENKKGLYGEKVLDDGTVVYLTNNNNTIVTEDATVVTTNIGLLNKDNFLGNKENAKQAFEVGKFYSFNAINPEWVTDEKATDNIYIIDGSATDPDTGYPTYMEGAWLECLLWNMVSPSTYETAVADLNDDFYYSLAKEVETQITVVNSTQIEVVVTLEDGSSYGMTMEDVNNTDMETADAYADISSQIEDGITAADPVEAEKLEKGIAALKTNNYVQTNLVFPDHSTELSYITYFTPTYVFYNCTSTFKRDYNNHLAADTEEWTEDPYGYAQKGDGIYKFTYNETDNTITWGTKEANTDANTKVSEYAECAYFSTLDVFNSSLKYAFDTTEEAIWNGKSTKYYKTTSREIFDEIINYYAPEDISDIVEKTQAGVGVTLSAAGEVTAVNATIGYTPFLKEGYDADSDHTYGVDYFSVTDFGNATDNIVDSLLGLN